MPNYGHIAICPFYRAEKNKSISCEDTFRRFKNENKRNAWATMYCDSWDWMKCPYAADLTEAYERYEKGDGMALENHENEALRTELEKMSRRLGMAEKRCERQQKKIDELRAVNVGAVCLPSQFICMSFLRHEHVAVCVLSAVASRMTIRCQTSCHFLITHRSPPVVVYNPSVPVCLHILCVHTSVPSSRLMTTQYPPHDVSRKHR